MKRGDVQTENRHCFEAVEQGGKETQTRKEVGQSATEAEKQLGQSAHRHTHKIAENHAD